MLERYLCKYYDIFSSEQMQVFLEIVAFKCLSQTFKKKEGCGNICSSRFSQKLIVSLP